nr:hypothetical protein [Cypionkella sp.]
AGRCGCVVGQPPDVAKIAFTGGESGGLAVCQAAAQLKTVTLDVSALGWNRSRDNQPMPEAVVY